jgi:hypothetical protein
MMPALALVGIRGPRWLPPLAIPLFLLWPLVPLCLGMARLLQGQRPSRAVKLRSAMQLLRELRGLAIDVRTRDHKVRIRFV